MSALTLYGLLPASTATAAPAHRGAHERATLQLDPRNPHFVLFHGRPTVLITSGEHYGAVMNEDFNYRAYLGELQSDHLNLTRVFSGEYREHVDEFTSIHLPANTLGPLPGRYLAPWARSSTPGYSDGGNKFDLTRWDPAYFRRLRDFVAQADKRGIAVEMVLFCSMYNQGVWSLSPLNGANNINGVGGNVSPSAVNTLDNGGLLRYQDALVRKMATELDSFDNVYYQIDNEPYITDAAATDAWQAHIVQTLTQTEAHLPRRHLIAEESAGSPKIVNPHPGVSIFDFEYQAPPAAATANYDLNRPMADDETGFRGSADATYRSEAWDFLLAGGSIFDNLDFSFTPSDPLGTQRPPADACCGGSPELRDQLGFLKSFISALPFEQMKPDNAAIASGPTTGTARVLAQEGRVYAVYLNSLGSTSHSDSLSLAVPRGHYRIRWYDPASGQAIASLSAYSQTGTLTLATPRFTDDAALLITRTNH